VRRGPLRPIELTPARRRISGRVLALRFKLIDQAALFLASACVVLLVGWREVVSAPALTVAPLVLAPLFAAPILRLFSAYDFTPRNTLFLQAVRVAGSIGLAAACAYGVTRLMAPVSLAATGDWLIAALFLLLMCHAGHLIVVDAARRANHLIPNIVIVGATDNARTLIEQALHTRHVNILGLFDDRAARAPEDVLGVPVLGDIDSLSRHKILPSIDRIVIAVPAAAEARINQLVEKLRVLPNAVTLFIDLKGDSARAAFEAISQAPLAQQGDMTPGPADLVSKRFMDIAVSAVALVVLAPVLVAIAVAIKLDSPGPILFRQKRHGFNNEEIEVWKFRSMKVESTDATASRQVSRNDDRVTRVGRFIRATSLDELPQFFNVLTGQMSVVGPRPHAIGMKSAGEETEKLVREYAWRHRVKPGVTGWAQIHGSRGPVDTPEDVRRRVELDVEYIRRQSVFLDLYIILVTVPCLLGDKTAVR
jgi:Undecaprenyl-phosphate glucose phosphotransferase